MNASFDKIESIVEGKRVKQHVFEPSQRVIWTVVGKGEEYWLDPNLEFCSCPGYYFGRLNGRLTCYHLESQKLAQKEIKCEIIKFSDDEFLSFISGLVTDL